jgi:hypothetical protein
MATLPLQMSFPLGGTLLFDTQLREERSEADPQRMSCWYTSGIIASTFADSPFFRNALPGNQ